MSGINIIISITPVLLFLTIAIRIFFFIACALYIVKELNPKKKNSMKFVKSASQTYFQLNVYK